MIKTNAMRILDQKKIPYQVHEYDPKNSLDALSVSRELNEDPKRVFKTLVTVGKSKNHYAFVIPATATLNLKKAAKASGEKNIEMILQKELLQLTGYIHGGCSPIGMKKAFKTYIDSSAKEFSSIFVSGGKIGLQVEIDPEDIGKVVNSEYFSNGGTEDE